MQNRNPVIAKVLNVLVFLFLYLPIAVLIIFSFNDSKSRTVWSGFSLHVCSRKSTSLASLKLRTARWQRVRLIFLTKVWFTSPQKKRKPRLLLRVMLL